MAWKNEHECPECGKMHQQNQALCGRCEQDRRNPERVARRIAKQNSSITKGRATSMNDRAIKLGLTDRVSVYELREIAPNDAKCPYCGVTITNGVFDHKIPLSRGGTNTIGNIAWVCKLCNAMKHDMTVGEFTAKVVALYQHMIGY